MSSAVMTEPALLRVDLVGLSDDELVDAWRSVERAMNQLAAVDQRIFIEAERRGLPGRFGARDVVALARGVLRVHPRDAAARARAAEAAVGRTSLSGVPCPAPYAKVGAAQTAGDISPRHASVITRAIEALPEELQAEHGQVIETELVDASRMFDPLELSRLATRRCTLLDQDGAMADVAYRARQRSLTITPRPDGSSTIHGDATAELTERFLTMLDALAAPAPSDDGVRDARSARQRNHDALLDALDLVARAELLPDAGGITTTVLLTASHDAWTNEHGVVTTGHGAQLPVPEAIRIAGGDHRVMTIELDHHRAVVGQTDARRLFSEKQRLAMAARDGGCSFPGCDVPPAWCQAHHVTDWSRGGRTDISNGTLLCGFHHREFESMGWSVRVQRGRPAWIPLPWIDPEQRPRRQTGPDEPRR